MADTITETKAQKARHNVSDDTISDFMREAAEAKREVDEAQGRYRAVLKKAKSAGVNQGVLVATLQAKKQEPEAVVMNLRDTLRYMQIAGIPVRSAGLFDEAAPVPALSQASKEADTGWAAEDAGYQTGKANGSRDDNPFPPGEQAHGQWDAGFRRGLQAVADQAQEGVKTASTRRAKNRAAGDDSIH